MSSMSPNLTLSLTTRIPTVSKQTLPTMSRPQPMHRASPIDSQKYHNVDAPLAMNIISDSQHNTVSFIDEDDDIDQSDSTYASLDANEDSSLISLTSTNTQATEASTESLPSVVDQSADALKFIVSPTTTNMNTLRTFLETQPSSSLSITYGGEEVSLYHAPSKTTRAFEVKMIEGTGPWIRQTSSQATHHTWCYVPCPIIVLMENENDDEEPFDIWLLHCPESKTIDQSDETDGILEHFLTLNDLKLLKEAIWIGRLKDLQDSSDIILHKALNWNRLKGYEEIASKRNAKINRMREFARKLVQHVELTGAELKFNIRINFNMAPDLIEFWDMESTETERPPRKGHPQDAHPYCRLVKFPTVVKHPNGHWYSLHCPDCGGNTECGQQEHHVYDKNNAMHNKEGGTTAAYMGGMKALQEHMHYVHSRTQPGDWDWHEWVMNMALKKFVPPTVKSIDKVRSLRSGRKDQSDLLVRRQKLKLPRVVGFTDALVFKNAALSFTSEEGDF
ncbi:hypothetical protein BT63DRAFT_451807 [Microthyrium microscopicum]|uniref:Uncharacterized protein n=1 Tax=Microthyrium microscopicum TaxID=703497 RepID=A0A6A6UNA2_9PEZI|nr:hypothetical protein BT63DRAFT_451807 [Microthyrium microscopicum]